MVVSDNPLDYFPTFEEWEALKRQVDEIEPMRLMAPQPLEGWTPGGQAANGEEFWNQINKQQEEDGS